MNTLHDAWSWYESARGQLRRMKRLAEKHWNVLLRDEGFWQDDFFRSAKAEDVSRDSDSAVGPLNDLAVLVLFSVFEAQVRDHVYAQIETEASALQHPALKHAAKETLSRVEEGSFFRVLEPFKKIDPNLIEQVNQVRRYRNWVAHGRRGPPAVQLGPRDAFVRLRAFLVAIGLTGGDAAP